MAAVKDTKKLAVFANEQEMVKVVYDFAKDAGATGALDLFEAKEDCVIHSAKVKVQTTFTSGGSATLIVGQTGDTDSVMQSVAVASLVAGLVKHADAACQNLKLASGDKVLMTIGTAAMTAGKMEVELVVSKF